ncbi:5-hydroxytryptamine receptor [Echinococcus granulosus]|uniref:5-hydroxytryptamine receptor n=2 Tax=Echinococcus granulosus TaxID=6210 RepID=W6USR1_ECHGR|nr:5-hydroxytryptamine receptor [Echinococcus granulosus]EUB64333.1 5-hydroxytryptamine receptor [Echinococcus granulosus]KAH9283620.1 5-hydroxytryptamine receptor [Echinococcus granulosus]
MVCAKEPTDCQAQFRYGEPTVFLIKRVKNRTAYQALCRGTVAWGPRGRFEPYYQNEYTILMLLVIACLILCTVFGNGLVVAALFLERSLQRFSNYLTVSLAVADLMLAALVMPISALDAVSTRWFMGLSICDFWIVMDVLCCTASILHLVDIAIDRYWAVTHADYSRRNNKKIIFGMIFFTWFAAITISLPSRFTITESSNLIAQVLKHRSCVINNDRVYTVFSTVGSFFLPMTFLLFIYIKIYASARKRIRRNKFKWLECPSSATTTMKTCESTITLTEAATISGVPPSPVKPLVKGTTGLFNHARLFNPTIWVDNGNDIDDVVYDCGHSPSSSPHPNDVPAIQSSFIPQTPLPTPHRAFDLQHLSSSPPSPLRTPSPKANGCINFNHLPCERKRKYAFDINISCALMSVKRSHLNKDFSVAAVETVVARRERLEHRRERRAAPTLAILTACFLLCWIPFSVNALVQPFCGKVFVLPTAGGRFFLWLGYLNSPLNPIIYTVFSPDYRKAFVKILTCGNNGFRTGKQRW